MSNAKSLNLNQLAEINMKSKTWSVRNKLMMYRGLVKLYNRDQENQIKDNAQCKKNNYKLITDLKLEITRLRGSSNAGAIYEAVLKSLLNKYEDLLPLHNEHPQKILQELTNKIGDKKSILNRIRHVEKANEIKLVESELLLNNLRESAAYVQVDRNDRRKSLQNQLQDEKAKYLCIRNLQAVFNRMINLLRKDQRYFEAVVASLQDESKLQQKCLIRGITMGQLATEEVANMRMEYHQQFRQIQANVIEQNQNMIDIQAQIDILLEESESLIRYESYDKFHLGSESKMSFQHDDELEIEAQTKQLANLLQRMKDATLVPDWRGVLPRMLEQLSQNERLQDELMKTRNSFTQVLKKSSHGNLILMDSVNQGLEEEANFENRRAILKNEINTLINEKLTHLREEKIKQSTAIIHLRNSLLQIWRIVSTVLKREEYLEEDRGHYEEAEDNRIDRIGKEAISLLSRLKMNSVRTLECVKGKISHEDKEKALIALLKRMERMRSIISRSELASQASLEVKIESHDPDIPTRAEIKAASKKICDLATSNPYEVARINKPRKDSKRRK